MDYAYTAQGWIKVMNAGSISSTRDMGRDGYSENISGSTSTNMYTALDASGFVLNYFSTSGNNGDYWAPALATAGTTNAYIPRLMSSGISTDCNNLYNGNISSMITSLTDQSEDIVTNQLTAYMYDQLNRIKQVRAYQNFNTSTNAFSGSTADPGLYAEDFAFDRNGNILFVQRNGNNSGATQAMDDFGYKYYDKTGSLITYDPLTGGMPLNATNKLSYVADDLSLSGNYTTDIDNQSSANYTYDANGNLITDASEEIDAIEWYANGKIKSITRDAASDKSDLEFIYDASGNRIIKITKPRDGTNVYPLGQMHWTYTYYVRDASGNVMGVYERTFREDEGSNDIFYDDYKNAELHIYGSKRVGTNNVDSLLTFAFEESGYTDAYGELFTGSVYDPITGASPCTTHCKTNHRRELGNKQYEVTNHLSNVLASVSDIRRNADYYSYDPWTTGTKYAYDAMKNVYYQSLSGTFERSGSKISPDPDNVTDYYTADVISYSDYYAYGAQMDGRFGGSYRYGMNGQEKDNEVNNTSGTSYSAEYWQYDSRLGRRWNVDPIVKSWESSYATFSNCPILISDPNGDTGGNAASQNPEGGDEEPSAVAKNVGTATGSVGIIDKKLTGSKNLIIYIVDDKNEKMNIKENRTNCSNWDYIIATDIVSAAKALQKRYGQNPAPFIENFYIRSHGCDGGLALNGKTGIGMEAGGGTDPDSPKPILWGNQLNNSPDDSRVVALTYIRSMLTSTATVVLGGCCAARYYNPQATMIACFFIQNTQRSVYLNWYYSDEIAGGEISGHTFQFDSPMILKDDRGTAPHGFVKYQYSPALGRVDHDKLEPNGFTNDVTLLSTGGFKVDQIRTYPSVVPGTAPDKK